MIDWLANHPWAILAAVVVAVVLGKVAYLILLERKVASWVQDRVGPNRVGPAGLLQPIADGLKMLVKEDYRPARTDRRLFTIAPAVIMVVAILSIAVVPWGGWVRRTAKVDVTGPEPRIVETYAGVPALSPPLAFFRQIPDQEQKRAEAEAAKVIPSNAVLDFAVSWSGQPDTLKVTTVGVTYRWPFQIASLDIGVLFVIAVLSLGVYGVVVGGWASNNKYSFLGGLRAAAQMISYEIPLGLALLCIVVMYGTLDLGELVQKQAHSWLGIVPAWNAFAQPLAFVLFLVCIHAEANRLPFDLAECEQELVGGYHTEYSSMRFGFFLLAEYAAMITTSAVCVALFFGGWHFPGLTGSVDPANPAVTDSIWIAILRSGVFFAKTMLVIFVFMWVRWSLPRFRFDQLMLMAWRGMIPLSLAALLATAIVVWAFGPRRANMQVGGTMALVLLAVNVALLAVAMLISRLLPAPPPTNRRIVVQGSRFASATRAIATMDRRA
jgi:NADH-quinone oxidoreductase subunit H